MHTIKEKSSSGFAIFASGMIRMYRYSEEGRPFLLVDGRDVEVPRFRKARSVHELCLVHGADGIGVLDKSDVADFRFGFIDASGRGTPASGLGSQVSSQAEASPANPRFVANARATDGTLSASSIAGAAICAVAFADLVGVKPFHSTEYTLEIAGEIYSASILSHLGECKVVSLSSPGHAPISGPAVCEGEVD